MKISTFLLVLFANLFVHSQESSNSLKYQWLESDTPERQSLILKSNSEVNQRISKSRNFKQMTNYFSEHYGKKNITKIKVNSLLKNQYQIIRDSGLNQPMVLQRISKEKEVENLFSTFQLSRKGDYQASYAQISPDEKFAIVLLRFNGSTDQREIIIIDLKTLKFTNFESGNVILKGLNKIPFFVNQNSFVYGQDQYDFSENQWVLRKKVDFFYSISPSSAENQFLVFEDSMDMYRQGQFVQKFKGKIFSENYASYIGENSEAAFFSLYSDDEDDASLFRYDKKSFAFENIYQTSTKNMSLIEKIPVKNGLVQVLQEGFDIKLKFVEINGTSLVKTTELHLQKDKRPLKIKSVSQNKLRVYYLSDRSNSESYFDWDLVNNKMINDNLKIDRDLEVQYHFVSSFDGTQIPLKLIYKKNSNDINTPSVYIDIYGGFGSNSEILPQSSDIFRNPKIKSSFLNQGGIIAAVSTRGTSDFGNDWHRMAIKENKIKTYEDLASAAKWLIEKKGIQKNRIVISGVSNGGLTTAATALLFPEYFGLSISSNGVLDLLGTIRMDEEFNGWSEEYGEPKEKSIFESMIKISPVEIVSKNQSDVKFLILNGRTDTRVHIAHSVKLKKAIIDSGEKSNSKTELYSVNKTGHNFMGGTLAHFQTIRIDSIKWSTIFDHLDYQFDQ